VVRCTGGLPYDRASYVDAQFISIRQTTSEKSTRKAKMMPVSVNFSKSCDLHRVMMREVIKGFDIYDYAEGGNCSPSRGNATFQFVTLF
ncbi:MAG: hypothetical protein KDD38_08835, partial [Bdellovibrionales bacterium]|nr:hypothetical protein [Bdellovibrionales bacterium]